MKSRLLVFATGSPEGGGSGFENLVHASRDGRLSADIVGVVSNNERGGVRAKADRLGISFRYFPGPYIQDGYETIVAEFAPDFVALSGWLKLVVGLDPKVTFNIHPAPLPTFGGPGFYGHATHEKVMEAYRSRKITHSAVSMHFVTEKFDDGPVFFKQTVEILSSDTADTLAKRVNEVEQKYQPAITDKVVRGEISWDGKDPSSLRGAILD